MASYSDAAETFQPTYRHPSMFVKVDGVRHMPGATREILQSLPKLKTRYDDVIIATWPKSGTTWTMEIVWQIFHDGEISEARIDERVNFLELLFMPTDPANKKTPDDVSEAFEGLPAPRLLKTHLSYGVIPNGEGQTEKPNIILVLRNPKDTVVSYYHHYTGIGILDCDCDWDEFFEHFMNGNLVFGSWFDYMREFWPHRNDSNLLILKYEDMKKDLLASVKRIACFVGKDLSPDMLNRIATQTIFTAMCDRPSFDHSWFGRKPGRPFNFLRKGQVGDWKNHFTDEQNKRFERVYEEKMGGTGLHLSYFD